MIEKSCCFTGHRVIPERDFVPLRKWLYSTLEKLIEEGFTDFYAGGAIGFDTLASETVLSLRDKYCHIRLHIIKPCENQDKMWTEAAKEKYRRINEAADEVKCLSNEYYNGCMQVRNRYMVNNSSVCIAYLTENKGGTASTVKYAETLNKKIITYRGERCA